MTADPESLRLEQDARREKNWKRFGPYLSERQWGTVREDYSADGGCWDYLPHDHARSRAYRWGEDGLLGITDRECRLCFALALWNGKDPILKERLFGLAGPEGNHGEDVKELYYYLDATPTSSYLKSLYKYPQGEFPYRRLVEEGRARGRGERELEIEATGAFDEGRYFDVLAEYAKAGPDDLLIRITVSNRGPEPATIHVLPTLWFRNTWSWGCAHEGCWVKPVIRQKGPGRLVADHVTLGRMRLDFEPGPRGRLREVLFTDNESNTQRLFGTKPLQPHVKDAFHRHVIAGEAGAVNPKLVGTKAAPHYVVTLPAGRTQVLRLRLAAIGKEAAPLEQPIDQPFGPGFDETFAARIAEADAFYAARVSPAATNEERAVIRQAYAGLLYTRQFYHYVVEHWLEGDPEQPKPPESRRRGRNHEWRHLFNRDVISVPDKWEYPWYAAWDLAFHMLPFAHVDPHFAKEQLVLFLREWYMHPNGQLPAYEFALNDVNPPVHAWAAWRVYKASAPAGRRDRVFLERVFQKLLLNFTWWVNRKDAEGKNLFSGGFLGLDNIGVFDRSKPLPTGGHLEQADGTAWMAFYCTTMLSMALELSRGNPAYEDLASKFFEHFVAIVDAMNRLGGTGLWDEQDGFYYDMLHLDGQGKDGEGESQPLRVRSMVGLIPLFAVEVLDDTELARTNRAYEDMASKFFEHFIAIVDAMNRLGGGGLWNEEDGFYYDQMHVGDRTIPLRVRSLVGVMPLIAAEIVEQTVIDELPGFKKRMEWFLRNRADLARHIGYMECGTCHDHRLLAIASRERLERVLRYLFDENEFLSPYGIRSVSKIHEKQPYVLELEGREYRVDYTPAEGNTALFGGNSNWRGPIWFPINFLLVEAFERYHHFYGDALQVEFPTGSGKRMNLDRVAREIATRLTSIFLPDGDGKRPCHGGDERYARDPHWKDLVLFHEYFHGDNGRGVGASHQTGWTALVASLLDGVARERNATVKSARKPAVARER